MTVPCSFRSSLARSKELLAAFTRRLPRRFESPCGVYVVCEWDCRIVVIQSSRRWYFLYQSRPVGAKSPAFRDPGPTHSQISQHSRRSDNKFRRTNRIPSSDGLESFSAAARVRPFVDIIKACETYTVQPGVEEAERLFTSKKPVVVEQ